MAKGYGDPSRYVREVLVEEEWLGHDYTREIIERSGLAPQVLPSGELPEIEGVYPENLGRGKQVLVLGGNRGRFFKPCPGTREYRCCDYQVLNIGSGCPMDCVYCILQAYLNTPWMRFYVNIDQLFAELDTALAPADTWYRIGTGEFTDSLALDRLTGLSTRLVPYMARQRRAVLELKTKSAVIDNLRELDHGGRTVVAWSLNAPSIMAGEEIRTATLEERLDAAVRCAEWGYPLAFHFDPIVIHPGWEEGYRFTIRTLFERVPAERIVWISLGALRYLPALKTIATGRFPASRFFFHEFVTGLDNKARYFREERVGLYRVLAQEIEARKHPDTCVYFCMENDTVWRQVFGFTPGERGGLPSMLDEAMRAKM